MGRCMQDQNHFVLNLILLNMSCVCGVVDVRDLDNGDPHTCCTLIFVIVVICTVYSVWNDHVVFDVLLNHSLASCISVHLIFIRLYFAMPT
jgi:hypothetical protein